ncbi:1-phosphatidylinositol phosphodiesterase [Golovinomyces cichoracearum]|uniref:1-phosphatidylinositol phosphodiesterase n=1 Tax=Golovinomyces cichoracearum TaxID=62708 RepID=A0A420I7L8_9PEZI|nr:1-phosphatidylinositol phosphodiesterase [Golovinomyces cichoracearum]
MESINELPSSNRLLNVCLRLYENIGVLDLRHLLFSQAEYIMKSPPLTIRNLTKTPIELKKLDRTEKNKNNYLSKAYNYVTGNLPRLSPQKLNSKPVRIHETEKEVPIDVGPFETKITNIQRKSDEIIRLIFLIDGQRYQLDNKSSRSPYSRTLTCLSPSPRLKLTAIYHPKSAHLALYSSGNLDTWMSSIEDDIPLSALSIPGTHNSPTCYTAFPSVRCQAVGVKKQLRNGIRFIDIRVQPESPEDPSKDNLILVHSAFPVSLTGNKYLRDVIKTIYDFLDNNPSETVILSLKREGVGKSTDQQLSKILHDHYVKDQSRWFTEDRIPTLGEARKKIVLIRRFSLDASLEGDNGRRIGCGIDAENWPDNCADGTCRGGNFRIQDFYALSASASIEKKIVYSIEQLVRSAKSMFDLNSAAANIPEPPFFVNFLSASNFWSVQFWPEKVASKVNPQIVEHLCLNHHKNKQSSSGFVEESNEYMGSGSTGIVVCDWVGKNGNWDLVICIVGMNARLQIY